MSLAHAGGVIEYPGGYSFSPMAREPAFLERWSAALERTERAIAELSATSKAVA